MNRGLVVLFLALAIPLAALAQDTQTDAVEGDAEMSNESTAAEALSVESRSSAEYVRYEAVDYGFRIELPGSGIITNPADPEWNEEESVAFVWQSSGDEPIQLILGRVDTFDAPVDEMTFNIVCGTMLESWEDDPSIYEIVTANDKLTTSTASGGAKREWNLIEIADTSHTDGEAVHYSMFSTYAGSSIYSITMYYLEPVNATIQEFGIPVIYSFELAN